ncbi:MAG: hypothetical protein MZU97_15350 [Bacillus subtilis]|nr:hypothetical protein [Bacillus subtilis]
MKSIDVVDIPIIYVFNKIDLVSDRSWKEHSPSVEVSAVTGEGINRLIALIDTELSKQKPPR